MKEKEIKQKTNPQFGHQAEIFLTSPNWRTNLRYSDGMDEKQASPPPSTLACNNKLKITLFMVRVKKDKRTKKVRRTDAGRQHQTKTKSESDSESK